MGRLSRVISSRKADRHSCRASLFLSVADQTSDLVEAGRCDGKLCVRDPGRLAEIGASRKTGVRDLSATAVLPTVDVDNRADRTKQVGVGDVAIVGAFVEGSLGEVASTGCLKAQTTGVELIVFNRQAELNPLAAADASAVFTAITFCAGIAAFAAVLIASIGIDAVLIAQSTAAGARALLCFKRAGLVSRGRRHRFC